MNEAVPKSVALPSGGPWPTSDPFLFCVHHHDDYPSGNSDHGPSVSLRGRDIGQDFSQRDGWNMYHGDVVPGFPQHPHRGFETISVMRGGLMDHADSLGAAARFGSGDVQWMTAGAGIVHSEMFPLLDQDRPNPLEMFQIWLNLPRKDKFVDPYFTMLWDAQVPRLIALDKHGRKCEVTIVAGVLDGLSAAPPPPNSWAARPEADVAVWHIRLDAGARWVMPPAASSDAVRTLYCYSGTGLAIDETTVGARTANVVSSDGPVTLAATTGPVECLVLQGCPIGEPVAQYGPFVMNDRGGIVQAYDDYERTRFGGWPWPSDGPVHGDEAVRFARHADGRIEHPPARAGAPLTV